MYFNILGYDGYENLNVMTYVEKPSINGYESNRNSLIQSYYNYIFGTFFILYLRKL